TRVSARTVASGQQEPVFRYVFSQVLQEGNLLPLAGAFHGIELGFVFGTLPQVVKQTPRAAEQALSDAVIGYWSRFAATGDPHGGGAPPWPCYDPATDPYLELHAPLSAGAGYHTDRCDFLESLGLVATT